MRAINEEGRVERIAELEEQLRWHKAEIQYSRQTIAHHEANIADIEGQLRALRTAAPPAPDATEKGEGTWTGSR